MLNTRATWQAAAARLAGLSADRRGTVVLWAGLVVLYALTAGYGSLSADVTGTYLPAWSLAQQHTADLDGFGHLSIWLHEIDGHLRSDRFAGAILVAVPAYWLLGDPDQVTVLPSALTAAVLAATTVALMHRSLLRLVGPGTALAGALVLALGTATWSVSADAQWTHTTTQVGLALTIYAVASRRPWLGAIGMLLAAAARPHTSVAAAVIGIGSLVRTRRIGTAVWLALGSLAGFAVVIVWSGLTLDHASLLPGTYTGRGGSPITAGSHESYGWLNNASGFLISPERGLLVLCPFVLPCLVGAVRCWRSVPGWVRDCAYAAVAYSVLQLSVNGFAGGWGFFSFRHAIEGLTLATPLLVLGAREICRSAPWARLLAVLVGYSLAVHVLGSVWYVNIDEGPKWWVVYQPWQMTAEAPWRTGVAVLVAAAITAVLVGLVRSDGADSEDPAGAAQRAVSSSRSSPA